LRRFLVANDAIADARPPDITGEAEHVEH